jgi:phosphoenolpyruvate-protein kinase (PTS system EI component)
MKNIISKRTVFKGEPIVGGFAVGYVFYYQDILTRQVKKKDLKKWQVEGEIKRLQKAIDKVHGDLGNLKSKVAKEIDPKHAEIFTAHQHILKDVELVEDIEKGLSSFFDLNALFNIDVKDTPEEQAKKKSLHQRFQKLTEEQKTVAQKKYQEEMQKKKTEQEEEQQKKEEEEAREKATIAPPSSPKKGPVGPFWGQSKKQKTQTMLQQSRQGLGQVGKKY